MPLTVSEVAALIKTAGQDHASVIERVRHWTREGLLKPLGKRNPGTGRKRLYPESAVEDGLILNALAGLGIAVGKVRYFMTLYELAQEGKKNWRDKAARGIAVYLVVYNPHRETRVGGTTVPILHEGGVPPIPPWSEVAVVINLTELLKRAQK